MGLNSAATPLASPGIFTAGAATAPSRAITRRRTIAAKPAASSGSLHPSHSVVVHQMPSPTAAPSQAKQDRRDRVVLEHLPLVKAIADRVRGYRPVYVALF